MDAPIAPYLQIEVRHLGDVLPPLLLGEDEGRLSVDALLPNARESLKNTVQNAGKKERGSSLARADIRFTVSGLARARFVRNLLKIGNVAPSSDLVDAQRSMKMNHSVSLFGDMSRTKRSACPRQHRQSDGHCGYARRVFPRRPRRLASRRGCLSAGLPTRRGLAHRG